ncbi:COG1361 S-layer family protein [Methanoregula sp.]|uniref:COG1361 S-layer family protein n=1 Tax=Methanoregula sp. TaxID=2052170 RepID=UPI0035684B24
MNTFRKISFANDCSRKQSGRNQTNSLLGLLVLIGIAIAFFIPIPAQAGDQYQAGSPVLSASLSGTNEFSPGQEVRLPIVVKNTGLNEFKFSKSSIVDRDDLPNTAKFLTISLGAGSSPLIIKSDPQMVGDLKASSTTTGTFTVRIPSDTPTGVYYLPVGLNYTYLYNANQYGTDTIEYSYKVKNENVEIPIHIKPDVRIHVVSQNIRNLNAGTEGYIDLVVKNNGHENARDAIVVIARNGQSPVTPTEGTVYIGNFPENGIANCTFRASVTSNAEAQSYPLDVYVRYKDHNGDTVTSDIETIGIPVGGKIGFAITPDPQSIAPGQKKIVTLKYTNTGGATAYQAQARISLVDPFTSNDDSAYMGDLKPGETRTVSFLITAEKTATLKDYGIDSEVRYRDALDNTVISDPLKFTLTVGADKGIVTSLFGNPLILGLIAVIIILTAGYVIYRKKRLQ